MLYPFVLSIPHCSHRVPDDIRPAIALTDKEILESVDRGTGEIFGALPAAAVLRAEWSRLVVDLNRTPGRLDEKGVIAKTDYHGRRIFHRGSEPDKEQTEDRVDMYYRPFHEKLSTCFKDPWVKALFDCHSLNGTGPRDAPDAGGKRRDITLSNYGDGHGKRVPGAGGITCPPDTMNGIKEAFEKSGFSVSLNYPYRGGYIMYHYGHDFETTGKIGIQIELNQDLYLDGSSHLSSKSKLAEVSKKIRDSFDAIARLFEGPL